MNDELIRKLREAAEEESEWCTDGKKMLEAGVLMQIYPCIQDTYSALSSQKVIEAVYICRGQAACLIGERQIDLRQGELLFLNQYAESKILFTEENDTAVRFILHPSFFDTVFVPLGGGENLLRNFLVRCLRERGRKSYYLHFKTAEVCPIQNFIENMIWMAMVHPNMHTANQVTMGLLFTLLLNYTDQLETGSESFEQDLVIQVLRYIEDNYRDGKLNELCQTLGYDIYWLSRAIKRLTGKNYKELLQIKRLNQAAYLLLNTRAAVAEVSLAVGYDNTSYFHRIFRDYYGLSPKEFRRENKRE